MECLDARECVSQNAFFEFHRLIPGIVSYYHRTSSLLGAHNVTPHPNNEN